MHLLWERRLDLVMGAAQITPSYSQQEYSQTIATTRQNIQQLQRFLKAPDPAVVYQGITLARSLAEPDIYAALLAGTRLLERSVLIDKVPFATVVPGRMLLGPGRTLALRTAATLALIALAPPGVAVSDRIRPQLSRLILRGAEAGAGLWHLDRLPVTALILARIGSLHCVDMVPRLAQLRLSSCTPLPSLRAAGLQEVEALRLSAHSLSGLAGLTVSSLRLSESVRGLAGLADLPGLSELSMKVGYADRLSLPPLPLLRRLTLTEVNRLEHLDALTATPDLTALSISRASHLRDLAPLQELSSLRELSLTNLDSLTALPRLDGLTHLTLSHLSLLSSLHLPDGLTQLSLHSLPILDHLPPLEPLSSLAVLNFGFCPRITALPDLSPVAPLREVRLYYSADLSTLPRMPAMAEGAAVRIDHMDGLTDVSSLSRTRGLSSLVLSDVRSLSTAALLGAAGLRTLHLGNGVRASLSLPAGLEALSGSPSGPHLSSCAGLRSLYLTDLRPEHLPHLALPELRELTVNSTRCPDLSGLSASLPRLAALALSGHTRTDDLAGLTGLRWLSLHAQAPLTDLSGLAGMRSLETLSLNPMAGGFSLAPLAALPALRHLTLVRSDVKGAARRDLSGLAGCPALEALLIPHDGRLTDLSALAELPRLSSLQLEGCRHITSFAPLAAIPTLHTLLLGEVADLSTLAGAESITRLAILSGTLSDLSVLSTLPALEEVAIGYCSQLYREALASLTRLPNLRRVYIEHQRIKMLTPKQRASFPGALLPLDYRPPWGLNTPKRPPLSSPG